MLIVVVCCLLVFVLGCCLRRCMLLVGCWVFVFFSLLLVALHCCWRLWFVGCSFLLYVAVVGGRCLSFVVCCLTLFDVFVFVYGCSLCAVACCLLFVVMFVCCVLLCIVCYGTFVVFG